MTDQVTPIKGFRQPPKPTKGEVQKENQTLGQQLQQRIQSMQQFFGNMINQLMKQGRSNEQELDLLTTWLAARPIDVGAEKEDHLLMDYAGVILNEDGTEATVELLDGQGEMKKVPDYFDGGSGKLFMLKNLGGGTLIPGFEEQLIGLKASEGKQLDVQFPKEYGVESLKDKKARFTVYIHEVRRPIANSPVGELIDANAKLRAEARAKALADAQAAAEKAKAEAQTAADEASLSAPVEAQAAETPAEDAVNTTSSPEVPQTEATASDNTPGAEQTPTT